ncbi:cyanophycin synthetase [Uliginosibacterium gangwonense]|uniref:cyanophycin synthetase n=1 Tax=Uliginosibacterium gangwonense TaxID=392736 RepID=UPI0003681B25|nr:cyanophycin synthetase [Uliginosibacterium gangwonense]
MDNKRDIEFRRITYLRGPNIWTYRPVIEVWVDIGELEEYPSNKLPGLYERLTTWLPGLIEHHCGVGERGGFIQRLQEGTWAGHILEHIVIELQNLAGMQTGFGQTRQAPGEHSLYKVAVRARNEQVCRAAFEYGRQLLMAAINDTSFDVANAIYVLREMVDDHHLGPSTACIVDAATARRIPSIRLTSGNLVQLGYGNTLRRIWTAETDRTSAIAEGIASDKDLTKQLLASCGIPIPEGQIVTTPDEAWEAAQDIGLPVVLKPTDANHGRGVSLDLNTQADIEAAFHIAAAEGSDVMVERFIRGTEHRLLVVGYKMVAAAKGEEAWVSGNGTATVRELIDQQINTDPRRGLTEDFPLNRILIDEDQAVVLELTRQGMRPETVLADGQRALIQRNGNVAIDVTDEVHPEVAEAVSLAARVIGLDIAGIDLVAEDISRPLEEQRGAIVEVNAGPGLLMHLKPAGGKPRPVGQAIVNHLFPEGESGRIPIVGVAGSLGTTVAARLIARLMNLSGLHVGLACRDGMFLDRRRVEKNDCANWTAQQRLLMNRSIGAAVFENRGTQILSDGLAYDRCQIGVVADMADAESLHPYYIQTPEQCYNVLRTQVDVVLDSGAAVLNADEPQIAKMADLCDGETVLFSHLGEGEALVEHCRQGGRAVLLRNDTVVLTQGGQEDELIALAKLAQVKKGAPEHFATSVLIAVAAAWALGIDVDLIRAGLETFELSQAVSSPDARLYKQTVR